MSHGTVLTAQGHLEAIVMFHFTDHDGYKAISSQQVWTFKASQPPGGHAVGAYFTTDGPNTRNLAKRLRLPRRKLTHVFSFTGNEGLRPIPGNRGEFIFWSPVDYNVDGPRQLYCGVTEDAP